ncbi:MAG: phosphonoacetaldehyde reductase [Pirellulales bacterium]
MKQITYVEPGAINQVPRILDRLGVESVFLVHDPVAYAVSGAEAILESIWGERVVQRFSDFEVNPRLPDVEEGIRRFRGGSYEAVVAVGGGSALDVAKLVSVIGVHERPPVDLIRGAEQITTDGPPLIAIPTTSGTGSEATHFAVCYVDQAKYSVAHPYLLPEYALVDPDLTHSLPPRQTAASGLDAFAQAVESFWSVGATESSLEFATEALQLSLDSLQDAVHRPDAKSRAGMSKAAHLAGKAINISKTTAPHAISYTITKQFGVPHGMAAALTLAPVLRFNAEVTPADCNDPRGAEHVKDRLQQLSRLLGCDDLCDAQDKITALVQSVGGPVRLQEVGVTTDQQVELIASHVNAERLANNPRRITAEALMSLFEGIR